MTAETNTEALEAAQSREGPGAWKKVYLAMLGTGVVVREESGRLFDYLVERGSPLEEPVRLGARATRERVAGDLRKAGSSVNRAVGRAVRRYAGPQPEEVAEVKAAVDDLDQRVSKL